MRRGRLWLPGLGLLGLLLAQCGMASSSVTTVPPERAAAEVARSHPVFTPIETDQATLYFLKIPTGYTVSVAAADSLQTVADFAQETGAIAVINAGFFDPQNAQTTSHIVIAGEAVADPATNERLVGSPDLAPYLDQILSRSEFRRYDCGGTPRYDIALHSAPVPEGCAIADSVGAGPQLLPRNTAYAEGFTDYADGALIRDAIGSESPNARSAVGLTAAGEVVWVMAAQQADAPGLTLAELAEAMAQQGIVKALNLDGGSSTSLFFDGQVYYGRLDAEGRSVQRPVKSVLVLTAPE
ncbi:MAG: phosphodiester glycosidase family protein [Leptolyngbya sp. SIO4C1]|nr:phosphodiester glycosidase family protein [Leptolyngbya sp. SIO4C1]